MGLARDGWVEIALKVLIGLLVVGMVYYCVCLSGARLRSALLREQVQLLQEQVQVLHQLRERSDQLCEIELGMGRVCRTALNDLIHRLGLDDQPKSAARTVLEAFDGLGGMP